jgi:TatD DNase family protein
MALEDPRLTDTHCHLDFEWYDEDREAVIANAVTSGVRRMLIPALDEDSCQAAIKLAEEHEQIFAAVGVHPNSGASWQPSTLTSLQQFTSHPKVVAVGEIGLDYYWDKADPELQKEIFGHQLKLAAESQLPVVIHNRKASEDTLKILESWVFDLKAANNPLVATPGVLHSFSGNWDQAQEALSMGFFLGFTGPVTFKKAQDLRELVSRTPLERILIETDAPFLTPEPYRGKRNEPAYVRFVADMIADVHQINRSDFIAQAWENAARLFKWA